MKKRLCHVSMALIVIVSIVAAMPTLAHAWSQSFHALVAKRCLNVQSKYIASYNARIGAMVPDFAWYLKDKGLIEDEAEILHGDTTDECVIPGDTTYLYQKASDLVPWWDYGSRYLAKGIGSHVYADIIAHNLVDGYVERWIAAFPAKAEVVDKEALHLALEFAVDALLIQKHGLQLADLLLPYRQANFVEEAVEAAIGNIQGVGLSQEFKKYVALMRVLEKLAGAYAPYLVRGEVDEGALRLLEESELFEAERELTEEGLESYYGVLMILLQYPAEIHKTITADGMHWEVALDAAVGFCKEPTVCVYEE
ncbi:MAG: zinc dependent phospholipase C family protein [Desulfobacterota bacterium]|nr:zinc dependent phospholipase C family protein [Thermodesulfobacteriota bacterium]